MSTRSLGNILIHFRFIAIFTAFAISFVVPAFTADLYVCNGNGTIARISPDGTVTTFVSGLGRPADIAFNSAGVMYVSDFDRHTISRISQDGVVTPFADGLNRPQGLAFDAADNLYVASFTDRNVVRIAPDGSRTTFASLLFGPDFLAFDAAGRLFVSGGSGVSVVMPDGTITARTDPENVHYGIAFNSEGELFGANGWNGDVGSADGTVKRIMPDGSAVTFAGGMDRPIDLAFDEADNLYVSALGDHTISRITPDGSLTTFPTGLWVPAGIAFAPVPEPNTLLLWGIAGIALVVLSSRLNG